MQLEVVRARSMKCIDRLGTRAEQPQGQIDFTDDLSKPGKVKCPGFCGAAVLFRLFDCLTFRLLTRGRNPGMRAEKPGRPDLPRGRPFLDRAPGRSDSHRLTPRESPTCTGTRLDHIVGSARRRRDRSLDDRLLARRACTP